MSPFTAGQRGVHVLPAIPPWCPEKREPATFIEHRSHGRILLRDDTMAKGNFFVECDPDTFIPDES